MIKIFYQTYKLETRPFDDDYMVYDYEDHRYRLTTKAIKVKLNIDIVNEYGEQEANYRLDDISEKLYDVIYENTNYQYLENNLKIKEYKMANDHKYRNELQRLMVVYIRASINTDIDAVGDEHGIDFNKGVKIEITNDVPMQVKRKLKRSELYFGGIYQYELEEGEYRNGY